MSADPTSPLTLAGSRGLFARWSLAQPIALGLGAMTVWNLAFLYHNFVQHRENYIYGDWVINYAGGLTRRGLGGEIFLAIASLLNVEPVLTAFVFVAVLIVLFFLLLSVLLRDRVTPFEAMVLASSPGLFFIMHNLDSGRKDILVLFLMALSLYVAHRTRGDLEALTRSALGFCALALVFAFMHEGVVFLSPVVWTPIALAFLAEGSIRRMIIGTGSFLAAMAAAMLTVQAWGTLGPEGIARICERLGDSAPMKCTEFGSATGWLQRDVFYGIGTVIDMAREPRTWLVYLPSFVAGVVLVWRVARNCQLGERVRARLPRPLRSIHVQIALFALTTAPLYVIAIDWGRWFFVWFTVSMLYLLGGRASGLIARKDGMILATEDRRRSAFAAAGLVLLTLVWSFPVTMTGQTRTVPQHIYTIMAG